MKNVILVTIMTSVFSGGAVAGNNGQWDIIDNSDGFQGSIHISCGASVAANSKVNCNGNKIYIGGGESYDDSKLKEDIQDLESKVDSWVDTDTVRSDESIDKTFATDTDVTEVKNELTNQDVRLDNVEIRVDQAHDRINAVQESLYDEGVIRAESDRVLAEGIKIAREESKNGDAYLQEQVDNKVNRSDYEADQVRQDEALSAAVSDSIVRDEVQDVKINDNSQAINENRENIVNNTVAIRKEEQARKDADVQLASQISEEALIRAEQDALTLAEAQLYADTGIQRQALAQAKVDQAQDQRITKNEQAISGLQQDVAELNGIVAGTLAASTFEMPRNWNGEFAIQAGIGGYKGANALAVGVVHAGEGYAVRATVTGSDADNFSELAYGASVTLSTSLFK